MHKLCSKAANRPIINSPRLLLASVAALAAFSMPARAWCSAPDWLRAAAQEKLPDYSKETLAVVLLDEEQITVKDNGEIDTLHRRAFRILRPEARENYGGITVIFDDETKIAYMKAWTITPDGHEMEVKDKDVFEGGDFSSEIEFNDIRYKNLQFPEPNPGSVIGYEYVQRNRPFVFEDDWRFQDPLPIRTARLFLHIPTGWEYSAEWFNYAEQKPQDSGANEYMWELHDIPAVEMEPEMPPWEAVAGWAGVKYFPRDPALRARSSGSWKDVGLWYDGLTQSSRVATPEIKQKVADLTAGLSDPLEKIRALTQYMQRNIRYYAIELGIGGYQPHPAGEVFSNQYGDCKDKATLLSAMLHEIGIESYYLIVDTDRGIVHLDYPSMRFDHMILAIRLPDQVNGVTLYSVVKDPQLGRLLIFDPTNEYVPLGYLPWYLQDNYGLLVTPEGGELLSLPLLPPPVNRLPRMAKFSLDPAGNLSGAVQEVRWGGPAAESRAELLEAIPAKRVEFFENFLGAFLSNFSLTDASIGDLDQFDQTLVYDYKFVSAGYAKQAGDLLILRPRVLGDKYTNLLALFADKKPRIYPVEFREATRQDDVFDITLPQGYVVDELPNPVQASCDYATYHSEIQVAGDTLHYKRTFEIRDVMVSVQKLPEIQAFLEQVAADQQSAAVLRRANP